MSKRIRREIMVDGEKRWITAPSEQEYAEKCAILLAGKTGETEKKESRPSSPFFKECAWQWFEVYKKPKVKPNTAYNYKHDMENHILPVFGNKRIDEIRTTDIQEFLNSKKDKAQSTVHHLWLILHGIFSMAKMDMIITFDPTDNASYFAMSKKKTKREALTSEDIQDIIDHLDVLDGYDRLFMALLIYTGMRRSEALGLRWEDVDFAKGVINVNRAVTFASNRPVVGGTKSEAGVRIIPLHQQLKDILTPVRHLSGYIIGQDQPFTETKYKRMWERIGKKIDLHGATAHTFRHTFITMASSHLDIKTLQSIAGHSDISTTMNRYAHGMEKKMIEAGNELRTMYQ